MCQVSEKIPVTGDEQEFQVIVHGPQVVLRLTDVHGVERDVEVPMRKVAQCPAMRALGAAAGVLLAFLASGCEGEGLSLGDQHELAVSVEATSPAPQLAPVVPPEAPVPPPPAPVVPAPVPVPPPVAPVAPPPAPVPPPALIPLPPPAPVPVPPEGCPCGTEPAQSCTDGLCHVFDVCSICRVEA